MFKDRSVRSGLLVFSFFEASGFFFVLVIVSFYCIPKSSALHLACLQGEGHGYPPVEGLRKELVAAVRKSIGAIATPDTIHWAPGMPKTRSGKIMRRILRKIANK